MTFDSGSETAATPGTAPQVDPLGVYAASGVPPGRRRRRVWLLGLTASIAALVIALVGLRVLALKPYYIPSGSMENTLQVGDRVMVDKLAYRLGDIERGDIVVFDGLESWDVVVSTGGGQVGATGHEYVKRVIGLPGDRIRCCDSGGRLVVNRSPLDEPYLYPGDAPSDTRFDIRVADETVWVMGDHRSASADSRAHIGDPGQGGIPIDSIVGQVVAIVWPWSERRML